MNYLESDIFEERDLYRKHFLNTLELARIVQSNSWPFCGTKVYFCLDLGLRSDQIKTIRYKGKNTEYLELYGGHICAPTFKNLPIESQHNLSLAAEIIIGELSDRVLTQDGYLKHTYYIDYIDKRIKNLSVKHRFPDAEKFCERVKYECKYCKLETPRYLYDTDYYSQKSDYYQVLIEKYSNELWNTIINNLRLDSDEDSNLRK